MKIEIYRDTNRQRRFRVRGNNGLIIAQGEGYHNLQDCLHTVALLIGMSDDNTSIEITDGRVAEINSAIGERAVAQDTTGFSDRQIGELVQQHAEMGQKMLALQAFKDYVHNTLTAMNVPVDPPGEHSAAGCRVGQRLECLHNQLRTLFAETRELRGQLMDAQQENNTLRELEAAHPSQARAPLQPGFAYAEVIVDRQGIRFGDAWYSHEYITRRTVDELEGHKANPPLGLAPSNYAQWVRSAINNSLHSSAAYAVACGESTLKPAVTMPPAPNTGVDPMEHAVKGPTPHMTLDEARAALAQDDRKPSPDDE